MNQGADTQYATHISTQNTAVESTIRNTHYVLCPKMMVLYNTQNGHRIRRLLNTLRKPYSP